MKPTCNYEKCGLKKVGKDGFLDEKALDEFYEKVYKMAIEEFGLDQDGDSFIDISMFDRTRYWSQPWFSIAYDHNLENEEEKDQQMALRLSNLSMAMEDVQRAYRKRLRDK